MVNKNCIFLYNVNNIILQLSEVNCFYSRLSRSHMSIIVNILTFTMKSLFLTYSIMLILCGSFYRLLMKFFTNHTKSINPLKHTHEDVFKTRHEIMKIQGHSIMEYQCQTEDGAYLSLWRISQNSSEQMEIKTDKVKKKPVLIQHGLLDCSMTWFLHPKAQNCLPFILAKEGYDVWIGNNRGTRFSQKNSHTDQYWEYTLDHLIQYDIPCLIDFILTETQSEKLIYIGHSQGTTQFLSAIDVHQDLGSKIECFIGLGPLISLKSVQRHSILLLLDKLKFCQALKKLGFQTVLKIPVWMSKLVGVLICNSQLFFKGLMFFLQQLCGYNTKKDRITVQRLGVIMSNEPGGTSVGNLMHWIQIYRKGYFHRYDYGQQKNMQIYNQPHPPAYTYDNLKTQQFQFHLFRGTTDRLVTDKDFNYLLQKLDPTKFKVYNVADYAHLDYVWCQDAYEDIYKTTLEILNNLQNKNKKIEKEQSEETLMEE